jgi:broad specificity phosphatase PhoE
VSSARTVDDAKTALVMVGLPARGKSFIARKLGRYLSWLGYPTRVFNVGSYRRAHLGDRVNHGFFDPENERGLSARREMALLALDDMLAWLRGGGSVAVYDATNSTRARRDLLRRRCSAAGVEVVFIETICEDPAIVEANIRATKLRSPDYAGIDPDEAVADFRQRIEHYRRAYETLGDDEGAYIKLIDAGRKVVMHGIQGYTPARVVAYLMNLRLSSRRIWLTRHGESLDNVDERIGGDAALSERGERFAAALRVFVARLPPEVIASLEVWTSTLGRTLQTAAPLRSAAPADGDEPPISSITVGASAAPLALSVRSWRALDEIDAGVCEGMTYSEIARKMPEEFDARASDKLHYRYPRGESYEDVVLRLEPLIAELERTTGPLLIISHQAVLRVLYAYLIGQSLEHSTRVPIPLHTVIELAPNAYGCDERRITLENAAADESSR